MKSTGIVRRVDQLGRIVVPKEIRKNLNIVEVVDSMEIYLEDGMIVFKKFDGNVAAAESCIISYHPLIAVFADNRNFHLIF